MKSEILQNIRKNKPAELALPEVKGFPVSFQLLPRFTEVLSQGGTQVVQLTQGGIKALIDELFPHRKLMATTLADLDSEVDLLVAKPHELKEVDLCILPAQLGVAENGALYLDESNMGHRVLPFITQHLVLVLNKHDLLATMHEAYERIDLAYGGFSVFIAGPSKTADIEQSLVIGAQGARSLTVVIKGET